ncbi:hypothetical protein HW132_31695 [Brasilonema sp. CT11]|nr:hypothetical protein [Brasilonema sp. CT11]
MMSITALEKTFYTIQPDIHEEAAKIAALVFPTTQFQLFSQKIETESLSVIFKGRHFSENFRLQFFPKINTLLLSGYYKEGMAHLTYTPSNKYNWRDGRGFKISSPDGIGEKFEFLANEFYPFLEEFFLG